MPGIEPKSRVDPIGEIIKVTENVPIRYAAQAVGVSLMQEWATIHDQDLNYYNGRIGCVPGTWYYCYFYAPIDSPAYITSMTIGIYASEMADRNLRSTLLFYVEDELVSYQLAFTVTNNGLVAPLTRPLKIATGKYLEFGHWNASEHLIDMEMAIQGFRI